MAKRKKREPIKTSIDGLVEDAYSGIEELKDEMQNWHDNIPENLQSGDKASTIEECISNLESDTAPDVPDCLQGRECEFTTTLGKRTGRAARCNEFIAMLDVALDAAAAKKSELEELGFNDDGKLLDDKDEPVEQVDGEPEVMTEEDRDSQVSEIDDFVTELESAKSNWESAEFPGLYG